MARPTPKDPPKPPKSQSRPTKKPAPKSKGKADRFGERTEHVKIRDGVIHLG